MGAKKVGALIVGLVLFVAPACGSDDGDDPRSTTSTSIPTIPTVPTPGSTDGPSDGPTDAGDVPPPPTDLAPPSGSDRPEAPAPSVGPGG